MNDQIKKMASLLKRAQAEIQDLNSKLIRRTKIAELEGDTAGKTDVISDAVRDMAINAGIAPEQAEILAQEVAQLVANGGMSQEEEMPEEELDELSEKVENVPNVPDGIKGQVEEAIKEARLCLKGNKKGATKKIAELIPLLLSKYAKLNSNASIGDLTPVTKSASAGSKQMEHALRNLKNFASK